MKPEQIGILCLALGVVMSLGGCGPDTGLLRGNPEGYLLTVDQLASPGFTVSVTPQAMSVSEFAAPDTQLAKTLASLGWQSAAHEEFLRQNADLRFSNGPVQIMDRIAVLDSSDHAAAAFAAESRKLDSLPGAVAVSTGGIGDESHAVTIVVTKNGLQLFEATVEWRNRNLLNVLVVRGRDGGTRLDDALLLSQRQTANELQAAR